MAIAQTIANEFYKVLAQKGGEPSGPLEADTVLLETGLDSLGFAILVTRLEDLLGYDPFMIMAEPVYPRTFGEFVDIYARFQSLESSA